jgi:hypothetical protein
MHTKFLFESLKGRRSLGRSRRRWEGNIKMDLKKNGGILWTGLICLKKPVADFGPCSSR